MSTHSGPNIIENGLVLNIDFANIKTGSPNKFLSLGNSGSGSAADNNVTFPVQGTGVFKRLGYGQTYGGYTIKENDIVYRYDLGLTGCHYHGFDIYHNSGTYMTITFDYFVSTDTVDLGVNNSLIIAVENGGAGLSWSYYENSWTKGAWKTVTTTIGPSTAYGFSRVLLYPGGCGNTYLASSGYILYKNVRVELSQTLGSKGFTSSTTWNPKDTVEGLTATINGVPTYSPNNHGLMIFDGVDDYLSLPTKTWNFSGGMTISAFVNFGNASNWERIIDFGNGSGNSNILFAREGTSNSLTLEIWNGGTSLGRPVVANGVLNNTMAHYCVTVNGTNCVFYRNGEQLSSTAYTGLPPTVSRTLNYIGKSNWADSLFESQMGCIQIYNTALSPTQIKSNFNALRGRYGI